MENLSIFEIPQTEIKFIYKEDVDSTYLEKLPYLNAYSNLIDSNLFLPLLYNKKLKTELFIKNTSIKLQMQKENIKYREDIEQLKNLTEKEVKSILYEDRFSPQSEIIIFLERFSLHIVSLYIKFPNKQAKILTEKSNPLKLMLIEFLLRYINYKEKELQSEYENKLPDIINSLINSRKNYTSIIEKLLEKSNTLKKPITFQRPGINYTITANKNKIEIHYDRIREFYNNSCSEAYLNSEDIPENPISLTEEIKIVKTHVKNILERNNTKNFNDLPQEDKIDFVNSYKKLQKLNERLKLSKIRINKNEKHRETTPA